MRILITAGPTREPIDPVRYIGNRSSGQMGIALAQAALAASHRVTLILGPVSLPPPGGASTVNVETTAQLHQAVMNAWPDHDILIMAAAVADYRPRHASEQKLARQDHLVLELEPTQDIVAAAVAVKRPEQKVVGFSLEAENDIARAIGKLQRKKLDMIVFNPLQTMNSQTIRATLLYADLRQENLPEMSKPAFATLLIQQAANLLSR